MYKTKIYYLFLLLLIVLVIACEVDNKEDIEIENNPHLSSFYLTPQSNNKLKDTVYAKITADYKILLFCNEIEKSDSIIPSFDGVFENVSVNNVSQISGKSSQNFNNIVQYKLQGGNGKSVIYDVIIKTGNGIPRIDINTENAEPVISKEEYLNAVIKISNCPDLGGAICDSCRIRGRGNATWHSLKKPYKIKFSKKMSPFGFEKNKDWVLLANFNDKSMIKTAYMCFVSNAIGMQFTTNYQYVDLFLNEEYEGTYLFTDFIERAKNRVNTEDDGFFIERDNWYDAEPIWFTTEVLNLNYTFKYPKFDKNDINNEGFVYINDYMNNVERALQKLCDNPNDLEYLNYIDIESFAKWYLVAQIICVYDANTYYVLENRNSLLEMYPMWDVEYSLGMWTTSWGPKPEPMYQQDVTVDKRLYFNYLVLSPLFRKTLLNIFAEKEKNFDDLSAFIDNTTSYITYTQECNFNRWFKDYYDTNFWNDEIEYTKSFINMRLRWVKDFLSNLN